MDLDNSIFLEGRIGSKPELREFAEDNAVLRFSLATKKSVRDGNGWKDMTTWHDCEIWGEAARRHAKRGAGDLVKIAGTVSYNKYEKTFYDAKGQPLVLRDAGGKVVRAQHKRAVIRVSRLRCKLVGRGGEEE